MKSVEEVKISKTNMIKICGIFFCNIAMFVCATVLYFAPREYRLKGEMFAVIGVLFLFLICIVLIHNSKDWTLDYSKLDKCIQATQISFLIFLLFFCIAGIILNKANIIQANVSTFCNICLILFWLGRFFLKGAMDEIIKNNK